MASGHDDGEPTPEQLAAAAARAERAAAFMAANDDEPLSPPLLVAGLVVLAWWLLLGWQVWQWWPRADAPMRAAAGVAALERDSNGDVSALRLGRGAEALRFECAHRGRWQLRALFVPLVQCRDGDVLAAAHGRRVHVRYDELSAGGRSLRRLLVLTVDGEPWWALDDSIARFGQQTMRAGFLGLLLLWPGLIVHRAWRARGR